VEQVARWVLAKVEGGDSGENLDLIIGRSLGGTVMERCSLNLEECVCEEEVDGFGWWLDIKNCKGKDGDGEGVTGRRKQEIVGGVL
jgi:hypothetical protein